MNKKEKKIIPLHPEVGQIYASLWDIKQFLLTYNWIIASSSEEKFTKNHYFICYDKDKTICIVVNISKDNRKFIITNVRTVPFEMFLRKAYLEKLRKGEIIQGGENVVK